MSKHISRSVSFVDAIENKYSVDENEELSIQIFVPKSAPGQRDSGEIVVPHELSLDQANISYAGETEKIVSLCKKVTFLDLSENQISDWKEVFHLLDCIPHCSFLDLRMNPLCREITCLPEDKRYPKLTKLVLNNLQLPWKVIFTLLNAFPKLQELHLSLNQYSIVDLQESSVYPQVLYLHFTYNKLSEWHELSKLGKIFPNLDTLLLLRNPLQNLAAVDVDEAATSFPRLRVISLAETNINSWKEIELFRHFPCLTHIRLQGIKFLEEHDEKIRRQLTLGYLPSISNLNGGKVTQIEREDAERAFIRYYMDHKEEEHPTRYHELHEIYGELDPLVNVDFSVEKTVHVTIHHGEKTFLKEIHLDINLKELKNQLKNDVGLSPQMMILHHNHVDDHFGMERMVFAERTMLRYGLKTGAKIYVDKKVK